MVGLSAAFSAGVAAALTPTPGLLILACLLPFPLARLRRPIQPFPRSPAVFLTPWVLVAAALTGWIHTQSALARVRACPGPRLESAGAAELRARFLSRPARDRVDLQVEWTGCSARVRAITRDLDPPVGPLVRVRGWWSVAGPRDLRRAWTAPRFVVAEVLGPAQEPPASFLTDLRSSVLAGHAAVQDRLRAGLPQGAPLAEALILSRREGLDPALRDAFARAGVAHLLAISGFHVGILALLLGIGLRYTGLGPAGRALGVGALLWTYVGVIGAPPAAVRATTMVTAAALARLRGVPAQTDGVVASALLLLLLVDPVALASPGLQLSFVGAVAITRAADRSRSSVADGSRAGAMLIRGTRMARSVVAPTVVATLATGPLVAWHFGEVSLVGIPASLALTPLVAASVVAVLATLASAPLGPLFDFLAGGTELLLGLLGRAVESLGGSHGVILTVSRGSVLWGGVGGCVVAAAGTRRAVRAGIRSSAVVAGCAAGVALAPVIQMPVAGRAVEIVVVDVGQGDAILLRSPRGRWVLVDAGPRSSGSGFDAGRDRVLPYLRRRGVRRLELMVLTHPDLDHIGGALSVLRGVQVGAVWDPGIARGSRPYAELLRHAREEGLIWTAAGAGRSVELDGMRVEVLAPDSIARVRGGSANASSVVLAVRYGAFDALLTGDATTAEEARLLGRLGPDPVEVLKVGHHGSTTSTGPALLAAARPSLAVIPVGRRNRYGHPDRSVLDRLSRAGIATLRTDRDGTVRIRATRDGTFSARLPDVFLGTSRPDMPGGM